MISGKLKHSNQNHKDHLGVPYYKKRGYTYIEGVASFFSGAISRYSLQSTSPRAGLVGFPLLSGLISLLRLKIYETRIFEIVIIDKQNEVAKFYRGQIRSRRYCKLG
jgi:hypothetical protein